MLPPALSICWRRLCAHSLRACNQKSRQFPHPHALRCRPVRRRTRAGPRRVAGGTLGAPKHGSAKGTSRIVGAIRLWSCATGFKLSGQPCFLGYTAREVERDRETERQRQRQRDRETETERARERDRERARARDRQRQRDRETERQRDRETERQREGQSERKRQTDRQRQTDRERESERDRDKERDRQRDRHRDTATQRHRDTDREAERQRDRDRVTHMCTHTMTPHGTLLVCFHANRGR